MIIIWIYPLFTVDIIGWYLGGPETITMLLDFSNDFKFIRNLKETNHEKAYESTRNDTYPDSSTVRLQYKENAPVKGSQFLLDTIIEITLYDEENLAKALLDQLFQEIQNSENKYSRHIEGSEVSMVNRNPGTPVAVSEDTLDLVQKSLYFSSLSNGLFDVSIGPLVDLWDISGENPRVPPQSEINAALDKIDYHKVKVDKEKETISIPGSGMSLDVGAIAKGYITDNLVSISQGLRYFIRTLNLAEILFIGKQNRRYC